MDKLEEFEKQRKEALANNNQALYDYITEKMTSYIRNNPIELNPDDLSKMNINEQRKLIEAKVKEAEIIKDETAKEYWSNILKSMEPKKEVKEEKEILKQGKDSRLIKSKDKGIILESRYLDVKVKSDNKKLVIELGESLIDLALDDTDGKDRFIERIFKIMNEIKESKDYDDIITFLNTIKGVGETGEIFQEALINIVEKRKQEFIANKDKKPDTKDSIDIENGIRKIQEGLKKADTIYQEATARGIDTDKLEDAALDYLNLLKDVDYLIKQADSKNRSDLEELLENLKKAIRTKKDRAYSTLDKLEEMNKRFNF